MGWGVASIHSPRFGGQKWHFLAFRCSFLPSVPLGGSKPTPKMGSGGIWGHFGPFSPTIPPETGLPCTQHRSVLISCAERRDFRGKTPWNRALGAALRPPRRSGGIWVQFGAVFLPTPHRKRLSIAHSTHFAPNRGIFGANAALRASGGKRHRKHRGKAALGAMLVTNVAV